MLLLILVTGNVYAKESLLVSDEWLVSHLNDEKLVILDARSKSEYDKLHIKGAISLPVASTFRKTTPTDRLASASDLAELYQLAGIDDESLVVVYDGADFRLAARVIWGLNVYGHDNARLLTVSFPFWQASGLPVSSEIPELKSKPFEPHIQPKRVASRLLTQWAIDNESTVLIDVRSAEEFRGEKSKSRLYGHIPSAINIDLERMIKRGEQGIQLKSPEELKALFSPITEGKKVITYCNKGHEASLVYLLLREFGNNEVSVYDGSWYEWGNSTDVPIEGSGETPTIPVEKESSTNKDS